MRVEFGDYVITDDKAMLNLETIHFLLSKSYWASQRPIEKIAKSIENSACYGVFHDGRQIGFARVVTDWATIYYLCDVIIDEEYRGQGIGKKLMGIIVNLDDYNRITGLLGTADAHGLYEQYGFKQNTDRFMIRRPK